MESQTQERSMGGSTKPHQEKKKRGNTGKTGADEKSPNCPRCDSTNTKFCYYNNYSLSQPRYFCKSCRRYWTKGGALRNVPVGGSCRKSKKPSSARVRTRDDSIIINPSPPYYCNNNNNTIMNPTNNPSGFLDNYGFLGNGLFLQTPTNVPFHSLNYGIGINAGSSSTMERGEMGNLYDQDCMTSGVLNLKHHQEVSYQRDEGDQSRENLGFPWHLLGGDEGNTNICNNTTTSAAADFEVTPSEIGFGPNYSWDGLINSPLM